MNKDIKPISPFIVGAGGVASYLLPVLVKTFPCKKLWVRDADILEKRNLDRQHFSPAQIGQSKASALLQNTEKLLFPGFFRGQNSRKDWIAEERWFSEGELPPTDADLLICVADNHTARRACLYAAESADIPCIIGGNEYYDSQVFYVQPDDIGTKYDPMIRYPDIATDTSEDPINCTGEAQIASPQLALANMRCASTILDLIWSYQVLTPDNDETYWPIEVYSTLNHVENTYRKDV